MESTNSTSSTLGKSDIDYIVANIGEYLIPLARELRLNPTQIAELNQGRESLEEKCYKMIQWWIQGEKQATKQAMITALAKIGRKDIAHELESSFTTPEPPLTDFTNFHRKLSNTYSHLSVPQPPRIQKAISIGEIFIDQEMEIRKTTKVSKEKSNILHLQNLILQLQHEGMVRVLVEGDPGFGKTTLAFKLANDWGSGKKYICNLFHCVLLLPLREVGNQKLKDVIVDLINRANKSSSIKREQLKEYLTDYKILLILDGYDELSLEARKVVRPILIKEDLASTCILVTSRRGLFTIKEVAVHSTRSIMFNDDNVDYDFWDLRVVLTGISADQRIEYLQNHFEIKVEAFAKMDELFDAKVDDLFRCPLLVFWLGWMLERKEVGEIPNKTAFYKELVNLIFHKTLVRENEIDDNEPIDIFTQPTTESEVSLRKDILQFGKLAIDKLLSKDVLFIQSELRALESSILLKSDLFLSYKTLTKNEEETNYQPMHRSFLEFLAAFSVCYSNNGSIDYDEFNQTISRLVNQGLVPSSDSLFFPFVAGLMENTPHWVFESLSPWSSLYHVDQPGMINVFTELQQVDDEIIELLLQFVPSFYEIKPFEGMNHPYFHGPFHKKLLEKAAEKQLISVIDWAIDIYPLPVVSIKLQRLRLTLEKENTSEQPEIKKAISFVHCKQLMYLINKSMDISSWQRYLSVSRTIKTDQHALNLSKCDSSTCSLILKLDPWTNINFHQVTLFECCLDVEHVDVVTQLVKDNRITKSITISLNENHNLTEACVNRLWEAVIQCKLITEFSFINTNSKFIPVFQCMEQFHRKQFQLLYFDGPFRIEHKTSETAALVQQLTLYNNNNEDTHTEKVFTNLTGTKYFEGYDRFIACLSSNALFQSNVSELYLHLEEKFRLDPSIVDLMPSLKTMFVDIGNFSSAFPENLENFVLKLSESRKLKVLGFHSVSLSALEFLVNCFKKVNFMQLECLHLQFNNCQMKLPIDTITKLGSLLKSKRIKQLCLLDWWCPVTSLSLSTLLPSWFSQEEFHFKYYLMGNGEMESIWSQQMFQHLTIFRDVYVIESKL